MMLTGHCVDMQMTRNKIQLSTSSQKCLLLQPIDDSQFCDWLYAISPLLVGQLRSFTTFDNLFYLLTNLLANASSHLHDSMLFYYYILSRMIQTGFRIQLRGIVKIEADIPRSYTIRKFKVKGNISHN